MFGNFENMYKEYANFVHVELVIVTHIFFIKLYNKPTIIV